VKEVYELWEKQLVPMPLAEAQQATDGRPIEIAQDPALASYVEHLFSNHLCRKATIKVCAVWDTVAALGAKIPRWLLEVRSRKLAFVNSRLCPNILNTFQALALDERRFLYEPRLWVEHESPRQTLTQCWFQGSHADVVADTRVIAFPIFLLLG
jgi:hypothetical protein